MSDCRGEVIGSAGSPSDRASRWVLFGRNLVEKIPNPIAEPEHYVYLTNFYVREEYRDQGLGSRLLAAVLDWAKSQNAEMIILWPTERSKPFYLRHGFSFAGDSMRLRIK